VIFVNRAEAGKTLASLLGNCADRSDVLVLGIPRGGVPVAFEVANALHAPLDVLVLRKLGVPGHEEFAFGAIASGGTRVLDDHVIHKLGLSASVVEGVIAREREELSRREKIYRHDLPALRLAGKLVILIDDGVATGASMMAGIHGLRQLNPAQIVVAVPVAPPETFERLASEVGEIVCVTTPKDFRAVGQFYDNFSEVSDAEVTNLLARNHGAAQTL